MMCICTNFCSTGQLVFANPEEIKMYKLSPAILIAFACDIEHQTLK